MEQFSSGYEEVIWPNRSFLDYVMAGLMFLIATLAGVALFVAYETGVMRSGYALLLYAGVLVVAPLWVGIRWLRYALNTKITVGWAGISFERAGGTAGYVPWDSIQWVMWYGREDKWPGCLELKYQDQGRGEVLRLRPLSPFVVRQVRWLRDHIVQRCRLDEMATQRRVTGPVFVDWMPTRVWHRADSESEKG